MEEELQLYVESYEDVQRLLQQLQTRLVVLGKRIRVAMDELLEATVPKLWSRVKSLGHMLEDAFQVDSLEDYYEAASIYGDALAGSLYQLSGSFSGLKIAVIQAVAPLAQLLVPVVRMAVEAVTGLVNSIGSVIATLFQGAEASDSYASGMYGAVSAGKAFQKSLAGFDQITRLGRSTGSGGGSNISSLTGDLPALTEKLLALLEPLRKLDFTPLAKSAERLKKALEPITRALFEALEWAWYNIFVPMAQWAAEQLLPAFLDTLAAALEALAQVIQELKPAFLWLWENYLKPLAEYKADQLIWQLESLSEELRGNGGVIAGNMNIVDAYIQSGHTLIGTLATMAEGFLGVSAAEAFFRVDFERLLEELVLARSPFGETVSSLELLGTGLQLLSERFDALTGSSNTAWSCLKTVWGNAWSYLKENLTEPAYNGMKELSNGILGLLNGMLQGVGTGYNHITEALNKFSFKLPDWIPILGGKGFSFSFPRISVPKIPMLAQGGVLPANRPFLAVVGDQRHGTNVEAPLATIQEAVALVMEDHTAANLAGHQATVAVLQQLLNAVLGIEIADETIGRAAARYDRKMAMMAGGAL